MKRIIGILAVIALIQVALTVKTWMGAPELQSHSRGSQLLSFKTSDIDTLQIQDSKSEVQLKKEENKWILADGFPADVDKINGLLKKLSGLQYNLPVATSPKALARFKVAKDNFERHLQLMSNNKVMAELYLGTGAGARQSHVRSGQQESVYSVAMGSYDLPVTPEGWQDKKILQFKVADVTDMELEDLKLRRKPDAGKKKGTPLWVDNSLPSGSAVNQQVANEGLSKLASLRFTRILGREEKPEYGLSEPLLTVNLIFKDGSRLYTFSKIKDSEDICLKVSDRDEYFQLASYLAKPILEKITKKSLVTSDPASNAQGMAEPEK